MRKFFEATAGTRSTRMRASDVDVGDIERAACTARRDTLRVIFGGLPSREPASFHVPTGVLPKWRSVTVSRPPAVVLPSTANGQRFHARRSPETASRSGATAIT